MTLRLPKLLTYSPHLIGNHELELTGGYEYIYNDNRDRFANAVGDSLADAVAERINSDYSPGAGMLF